VILEGWEATSFPREAMWDVVVAGAGAVGLTMALQMTRAGKRVLVLECGPIQMPSNYKDLNAGVCTGVSHRGLSEGRVKAFGGTTKLWGGQLVPFGALDIDGSIEAPSLWPVRHADLQPYYAAALKLLGIDLPSADEDTVWAGVGERRPLLGKNLRLGMNIWLPEPDFTKLFGREIRASKSLTVLVNAELTALMFDDTGRTVSSVEISTTAGKISISTPVVVLACGTLENVRLLLRTAATLPTIPFSQNKNLGQGFIDHIHGLAGRVVIKDRRTASRYFDHIYHSGRKYGVKIRMEDAYRTDHRISNCAATLNARFGAATLVREMLSLTRRTFNTGDVRSLQELSKGASSMATTIFPLAWRYLMERRSSHFLSGDVYLGLELEQLRTSRSYLFLDPNAPPESAAIGVHWGFDGREIEAAACICAEIDRAFRVAQIGHVEVDERIVARDPAFLVDCHDSDHHMGGSAMTDSPKTGVVDKDLRVFDTNNLYVLGAATFPSGGFANPTLTAIALSLRLVAHLEHRC